MLVERSGQRDLVTAVCPAAWSLGLRVGMAAAHARALVTDLDVRDADPAADRAWLDRLALHAIAHWTPTASVADPRDPVWTPRGRTLGAPQYGTAAEQEEILRLRSHDFH